jgi:hypothetical protein
LAQHDASSFGVFTLIKNPAPMGRFDKKIKLFGEVLSKGVWLYIADVKRYNERIFLYVGKTGRKHVPEETSPWARLAAHLDDESKPNNCILYHLRNQGVNPEECVFELSCFGPNLVGDGVSEKEEHEIIEEAEAQLAERLKASGYPVVGKHNHKTVFEIKARCIVYKIIKTLQKKYLNNLQ